MYHDKVPIKSDGGSTSYYALPEFATELQHLIEHKRMGFAQGNIFKAAYRLGEKDGVSVRYDLNKIIRFANFMLQEMDRADFDAEQVAEDQAAATWFAEEQAKAEAEHEGCYHCKGGTEPCICPKSAPSSPIPSYKTVSAPGYKTRGNASPLKELAEVGDKILIQKDNHSGPEWHTVNDTVKNMIDGFAYRVDFVEGNPNNLLIVPHHHILDIDKPF